MATINTDQLDKINEQLEGVLTMLDDYCEEIQKQIDVAPDKAQEILDAKMQQISDSLQERGNTIRQRCINFLKPQMAKIKEKIKPILPLVELLQGGIKPDFGAIIETLMLIIEILIAPYQPYIDFITQLPPKLITLSNNLMKLATWRPNLRPPKEGIVIPTPKVEIKEITMGDIM